MSVRRACASPPGRTAACRWRSRSSRSVGADNYVYGTSDVKGTPHSVIVRVPGRQVPAKGDILHVSPDPEHLHVFDTATGERIS